MENQPDEFVTLERRLERLEGNAALHGRTDAIEREIQETCQRLDEIDLGAGEDWLMRRDQELGRALG